MDYVQQNTGNDICTGMSIVDLIHSDGADTSELEDGSGVLYDISLHGSSVTFSVNNPFEENADVYVRMQKASNGGFLSYDCETTKAQAPCLGPADPVENTFSAACIPGSNHATVKLFFATGSPEVLSFEGEDATIPNCCVPDVYDPATTGIVELVYTIDCSCPDATPARKLLRGSSS